MRKDIVALILEKDGKYLVEKRKLSKITAPGAVTFPGGHVKGNETKIQALEREISEELGIKIYNPKLVHMDDFDCEEKQRIYWYGCNEFEGEIKNNEAEELIWISGSEKNIFTYDNTRCAFINYVNGIFIEE